MKVDPIAAARRCYSIPAWSAGYFDVLPDGVLGVYMPTDTAAIPVPLPELVAAAQERGLSLPLLMRFPTILADRLRCLRTAFHTAIAAHAPGQRYRPVYPIKANQQRAVVKAILDAVPECGLEVGSRTELLLALALATPQTTIICNGCKDEQWLQLALSGRCLGLEVYLVAENLEELRQILRLSARMRVTPLLGLRVRLQTIAGGNWQSTCGAKSKFGLGPSALWQAVELLRRSGQLAAFQLLHFHIGSQVPDLQRFKAALREGARYYAALYKLGVPLQWLDAGGGLAVDYQGTASVENCSCNYSVNDYADSLVQILQTVCAAENVPCHGIFKE